MQLYRNFFYEKVMTEKVDRDVTSLIKNKLYLYGLDFAVELLQAKVHKRTNRYVLMRTLNMEKLKTMKVIGLINPLAHIVLKHRETDKDMMRIGTY